MKKYYTPATMKVITLESGNGFLVGSVNPKDLKSVDLNVHTDDYETKNINWDDISFE